MSLAQMLPKRKHSSKQPLRVQALTCWTTCELCFTWCGPLVFGFMPYEPSLAPERAVRQGPDPVK